MILGDKIFKKYIASEQIQPAARKLGTAIAGEYADKNPVCIVVMQGAFMFATDLLQQFQYPVETAFVRVSSYTGTASGNIAPVTSLPDVANRHVIIIEDIIDTGNTLQYLTRALQALSPLSVVTVALLQKQIDRTLSADRYCFEIPDVFVVGYGLDYNGNGRNLRDIWQLAE